MRSRQRKSSHTSKRSGPGGEGEDSDLNRASEGRVDTVSRSSEWGERRENGGGRKLRKAGEWRSMWGRGRRSILAK